MQKLVLPTPRLPLCCVRVLAAQKKGKEEEGTRSSSSDSPRKGREEGCACVGKGRAGECSRVGRLDVPPRLHSVMEGRSGGAPRHEGKKDDLATTRKEIMPVEEREKVALLLLEKDSLIAQLETKLKVDSDSQTEHAQKLASAQLQLERLSITIQQHNSETEALRNNLTEIHLLESRLASQEKKAQEADSQQLQADGQASAALTAENKKLAAEVEALRANVKASNQRLWHAIESHEMKYGIIERLLSEKQEEVDFLKNEVARLTRNAGGGPLPLHKVFASAAPRKPAQVVAQKPTVVVLTPKTKAGQPAAQGEVSASAQRKPAQVVAGKAAVVASTPVTEPGELASKDPPLPEYRQFYSSC
ncbi:hypothetical protein HPB48_015869 [Haemaphysalis longicornis]|uniref:Uncharacterized protein n=1 Tax=Haemaphysalis longicornis TaxID=44386 RepID=A0A9J6GYW8_HAELO|nr:hypothetical protein HPB48_015869 [Haemaphysalis longicornis]